MSVTHLLDANTSFIAFCKEELFLQQKKRESEVQLLQSDILKTGADVND